MASPRTRAPVDRRLRGTALAEKVRAAASRTAASVADWGSILRAAYLPLLLLAGAGLALRVFVMIVYEPAVLDNSDSARYLYWAAAEHGVIGSSFAPAGYPAFLWLTHAVVDRLELPIALQHLLGVATALLLYLAVRRLSAPRPLALVPAAIVLLWGDQLYLEHALLTEAPFGALLAAALYACVRSLEGSRAWLLAAGAVLAAAALMRGAGLPLVAVTAIWALAATPGPGARRRLLAAGAVVVAALVPLAAYAGLAAAVDRPAGLTGIGGWHLYSRVAPFADCTRFRPPAGTEGLCERVAAGRRAGPSFYLTGAASPARRRFGAPPAENSRLGAFARAAIAAQPLDYARAVGEDVLRFVDPGLGSPPPQSGSDQRTLSFDIRSQAAEARVERAAAHSYAGAETRAGELSLLVSYQRLSRPGGWLLLAFLATAIAGALRARGRLHAGILLFALGALTLYVVPSALVGYTARFGVPALPPLAAAAALGAWALARERLEAARPGPASRAGSATG